MANEGSGAAGATVTDQDAGPSTESGLLTSIVLEIVSSPLNLILTCVIAFLLYKIMKGRQPAPVAAPLPELPRIRRDFTVAELKKYDGTQPDGRVLLAINGSIYDVTKGKRFYGPGGPYAAFGGRDASRGLATFNVASNDDCEYDDLSDLNSVEMESIREWEMQLKEKYILVGRLLKPGERPTNYSDEDDEAMSEPTGLASARAGLVTSTPVSAAAPAPAPATVPAPSAAAPAPPAEGKATEATEQPKTAQVDKEEKGETKEVPVPSAPVAEMEE